MPQLTELHELPKTSTGVPTVRKPKLVCVDDEPLILEILERLVELRGLDWDVEVFSDSLKAWDYLRLNEADIIVTDVSMPGLSGPDLVRRLRKNESTRDTPVVVLTGLHEASLKRQVLDLGATDLLSKPIQPDELLARLRSALRLKQMQDALKRQNERLEQTVARTDAPASGVADRDHLAAGEGGRVP